MHTQRRPGRGSSGLCSWRSLLALLLAVALEGTRSPSIVFGQSFQVLDPPISRPELEEVIGVVGLSEDQAAAVRVLHEGFLDEFAAKAAPLRELRRRREDAVAQNLPEAKQLIVEHNAALDRFLATRADAEIAFLNDLEATLLPRQLADTWPAALRRLRRNDLRIVTGYPPCWWFRLDLVKAVDEVKLAPEDRARVANALETWEIEVDVPLSQRRKLWLEELHWPPEQQQRMEAEQEARYRALGVRVAKITRRAARHVLGLLGDDAKARLNELIRSRVYPLVAKAPRPTKGLLAKLDLIADLDASQRAAIRSAAEDYASGSDALDRQGEALCEEAEEAVAAYYEAPERERVAMQRRGEDPESLTRRRIAQLRKDFEDRAGARLREVLTDSQRAALERN